MTYGYPNMDGQELYVLTTLSYTRPRVVLDMLNVLEGDTMLSTTEIETGNCIYIGKYKGSI